MGMKGKFKNFFGIEDEYDFVDEVEDDEELDERGKEKNNVVSLSSVQKSSKMILCEPRSYSEVQEIADHMIHRRAVVINLQRVDTEQARQIIDFMSGTVYALSGQIKKLGSQTFLCTPDHVEVSGNITEIMEEADPEQRW
ncbi:cell division machinery factor [Gracilibacillus halophilus YIM-C55.5]|uniref:Cell division protein SepF n=1 Tax=Gracilibacillus halophilus YIM-C55.5 TaxID=1308866 RepID=N4WGB9_9BACI|nr:cell division protein SepF [Gracilibacillus halophilus]ENH98314.1 cell division machinery factor [Gracilibacillus halophilus YIM-C55.5]